MKRIVYTLLTVIMVFTAATLPASAQSEESRQVSGFSRIISGEALNVHVKIDGTESLKISTRADIIKVIETVVKNGTLTIKFKDNLKNGEGDTDGPIDIYVTAKSLSSIVKEGSGSIAVDGVVTGSDVTFVVNGSGNIQSAVKSGNLHATISGAGTIRLSGTAGEAKMTINGAGNIAGRDLKTKHASVIITGAGTANFAADKTVSAHITGSGGVVYSGNATVTDSKIVGSGGVSKVD
jgi:hypothetical protein